MRTTLRERSWIVSASVLAVLVVLAIGIIVVSGQKSQKPTLSDKVRTVATQLRCPVCQGESVYDSPSGLALSMRGVIRRQLQAGRTPAQVRNYFVDRYGQWILLAPPATGIGSVAWLAPPILLLGGLLFVSMLLLTWRRNRQAITPAIPSDDWTPEEADSALELLTMRLEDGSISESAYSQERTIIEDRKRSLERRRVPADRSRGSRKTLLHAFLLLGAAVIIAGTLSLSYESRGNGPITGSIPSSTATGSSAVPSTAPRDIVQAARGVSAHPKSAPAWTHLGARMLLHREYAGARLAFQRAEQLNPKTVTAHLGIAFIDIGKGKDPGAISQLRGVEQFDPSSSRLWLLKGLAEARIPGDRQEALSAWSHFLKLSPNNSLSASVRGWMKSLKQGKPVP